MLCSIGNDIKKFTKAVRSHWGIESMHWSLDVTFNEDARKSKKDHAPENLVLLNKLALNILKLDTSKKTSSWKICLTTVYGQAIASSYGAYPETGLHG